MSEYLSVDTELLRKLVDRLQAHVSQSVRLAYRLVEAPLQLGDDHAGQEFGSQLHPLRRNIAGSAFLHARAMHGTALGLDDLGKAYDRTELHNSGLAPRRGKAAEPLQPVPADAVDLIKPSPVQPHGGPRPGH